VQGIRLFVLSKELIAASTVPLVLSVLAEGENYGYALIRRVRELSGGNIEWTEGMLYPVLHWMEDEGMIDSEWQQADSNRRRKYYRLRKEGRKALQRQQEQWMSVHETFAKLWKTQPRLT
jgi:DNA-binding PadR family transcriptional regulator